MYQEYSTSTVYKILFGIFAAASGGAAVMMAAKIFNQTSPVLLLWVIAMLLFLFLVLLKVITSKIIIEDDTITVSNLFYKRQLNFKQVKGYRFENKRIIVEPFAAADKKLNIIGVNNYEDLSDFRKLLREKFTDLNDADLKREQDTVLHNTNLGTTEAEREANLNKAKQHAAIYNIAGAAAGITAFFIDNGYALLCLTLILPLIACVMMLTGKGLITFISDRKRSPYPNLIIGFFMTCFFAFLTGITRFYILSYTYYWIPFSIISGFMLILLILSGRNRTDTAPRGQVLAMLLFSLLYGVGFTTQVNCILDGSYPMKFNTTVQDKRITTGKGNHYHLTLAPWQRGQKPIDIDVRRTEYEQTAVDSPVGVHVKSGLLHIPWFYVDLGE